MSSSCRPSQKVKVSREALLERVRQARARAEEGQEALKEKALATKRVKDRELYEVWCNHENMTVEEFMEVDYRFRRSNYSADFDRVIAMLEISVEDILTISADSDLASYL